VQWVSHHLGTLSDPGDGKGASARVKGALGALASVDERYRPTQRVDHHVTGQIEHRPVFAPVDIIPGKLIDGPTTGAVKAIEGPEAAVDELVGDGGDGMTLEVELGGDSSTEGDSEV
jgi:hypothetical protein